MVLETVSSRSAGSLSSRVLVQSLLGVWRPAGAEEKFEDFTKETVVLKGILEHFADGSQEASLSIHAHVEQSVFNDLVHHLSVSSRIVDARVGEGVSLLPK